MKQFWDELKDVRLWRLVAYGNSWTTSLFGVYALLKGDVVKAGFLAIVNFGWITLYKKLRDKV